LTRRQRIDLALLLIVRRAERDTRMSNYSHFDEPDTLTVIDRLGHLDDARSTQSS
jgi:hypothetical protein